MKKIFFLLLLITINKAIYSIPDGINKDSDTLQLYFNNLIESCKKIVYNNPDSAMSIAKEALTQSFKLKDSNQVAIAYNTLGLIEIFKGNNNQAEEYCVKALGFIDTTLNPLLFSNINNNRAKNFKDQQEYKKALNLYITSLNIRENLRDTLGQIGSLINIGGLYSAMENTELSLDYYFKALSFSKNISDLKTLGALYNNIAITYKKLNKYDESIKFYRKAYEIFKNIDYLKAQANILGNIGVLYGDLINNKDSALFYYNSALKIHYDINDSYGIAMTKINIALLLTQKNQYEEAKKLFFESEEIAKQINSSRLLEYTYDGLKDLYEKNQNYQKAYYYYKINRSIVDSIFTIEKNKQIAELESKYQTVQKDKEIQGLQKNNEIKRLQIQEHIQKVKAQRRLFIITIFSVISIGFIIWILFQNFKKKQIIKQQKLEFQKVTTEQKMLRSQMNPHFIYNSLNSIQSFISSNKSYEAEKYLARFAKLMRGILENSRTDFISLDKEIEILELYIELEQLRFENRFSFTFNIDNDLETEFIAIPPMLIQPFVENAILHGFKSKTDGILTISFSEKNDCVICEIDDNGIGRNASSDKTTNKKHASLATTITTERLNSLSEQLNKPAFFTINDKIDHKTQDALGTTVIINIPFINS